MQVIDRESLRQFITNICVNIVAMAIQCMVNFLTFSLSSCQTDNILELVTQGTSPPRTLGLLFPNQ